MHLNTELVEAVTEAPGMWPFPLLTCLLLLPRECGPVSPGRPVPTSSSRPVQHSPGWDLGTGSDVMRGTQVPREAS